MSADNWNAKSDRDELGSLAQSARKTSLKQARGILIAIGVLNLLVGCVLFVISEDLARKDFQKEVAAEKQKAGPGAEFDPVILKQLEDEQVQEARLMPIIATGLGSVFLALGLAVYRAPVACTVAGLVIYAAVQALGAINDPKSIRQWIIVKILIVIALVKAVQAAVAYERESRAEREARLAGAADESLGF